jgi:amino acid transporter
MASSGPTASIALTLAAIVSAANYAGPIAILVCALPMFGIALAYRRLNRWQVNCGASYTWIGRAITPYPGFIVGWIMLLGYFRARHQTDYFSRPVEAYQPGQPG